MSHAFACLLVHVVFSTKDRAPEISPDLADRLFPYMAGIVRELRAAPMIVNGAPDHVHLLVSMPPKVSLADFVRVLKTNSSRWVHDHFADRRRFAWQTGYGAFTVSESRSEVVRNYIASQQARHRRVSFEDEFLALLRKHGLEYDLQDVWG